MNYRKVGTHSVKDDYKINCNVSFVGPVPLQLKELKYLMLLK